MALFQPFKATTNPQNSKLVAATLKQAELDQQQQIAKNQAANANYASAIGLGGGMYGEYKDKESPIGQKLREWTGAESGEDVTIDANRLTGERTPTTPEDSLSGGCGSETPVSLQHMVRLIFVLHNRFDCPRLQRLNLIVPMDTP